jgi:hypothetical protein
MQVVAVTIIMVDVGLNGINLVAMVAVLGSEGILVEIIIEQVVVEVIEEVIVDVFFFYTIFYFIVKKMEINF